MAVKVTVAVLAHYFKRESKSNFVGNARYDLKRTIFRSRFFQLYLNQLVNFSFFGSHLYHSHNLEKVTIKVMNLTSNVKYYILLQTRNIC